MTDIGRHTLAVSGALPARDRDVLLVLGSAPGGVEEAGAFWIRHVCDVAAVNDAIGAWPGPLKIAASLHPEILAERLSRRVVRDVRTAVVSSAAGPEVNVVLSSDRAVGSSAMLAVLAGKVMGYPRIVLAGVRLERGIDRPYRGMWSADRIAGTLDNVETLADSGWLADLLGR